MTLTTEQHQTIAAQAADLLVPGEWTGQDGRDLPEVCESLGGCFVGRDKSPEVAHADMQWQFGDGSAITVHGDVWATGYAECGCWADLGHDENCEVQP